MLLEQAELMTPQESLADIACAVRENVRARLRVMVKRVLKKHGYPSDKQERATLTVLEQAEVLGWADEVMRAQLDRKRLVKPSGEWERI